MSENQNQAGRQDKRISKDEYYLGIAREVSRRSTCFRRTIGAIIVRDDQIISTGYVGAPRKTKDSLQHGFCLRDRLTFPTDRDMNSAARFMPSRMPLSMRPEPE